MSERSKHQEERAVGTGFGAGIEQLPPEFIPPARQRRQAVRTSVD